MDAFLDGPGMYGLQKVWSDEAREAALAARRANAAGHTGRGASEGGPGEHSGVPAGVSTQGGAETHQAATSHGWSRSGEASDEAGTQEYEHPASDKKIRVKPSGQWSHGEIAGQDQNDLKQYLTHLHGQTAADKPASAAPEKSPASWGRVDGDQTLPSGTADERTRRRRRGPFGVV